MSAASAFATARKAFTGAAVAAAAPFYAELAADHYNVQAFTSTQWLTVLAAGVLGFTAVYHVPNSSPLAKLQDAAEAWAEGVVDSPEAVAADASVPLEN